MNNNDEDDDDPINDRYKIKEAQNDNTNVNLGREKRRKLKNPRYFNEKTVNTITTEMEKISKKHVEDKVFDTNYGEDIMPTIIEYVLTQYNLKQGRAKFGENERKPLRKSCHKFTT